MFTKKIFNVLSQLNSSCMTLDIKEGVKILKDKTHHRCIVYKGGGVYCYSYIETNDDF